MSINLGKELIRAAKAGNKERVGALLERKAPVDSMSHSQDTALMLSAENGHLDVVKLLAAKGANIHHRNAVDCTALILAAIHDRTSVCLFIISLGADPNAMDCCKRTALANYGEVAKAGVEKAERQASLQMARDAYVRIPNSQLQCIVNATASLLFSATFSDLVFVCPGGERIHAHRNIVAACSPHIRALLQGNWAENAGGGQASEVKMPQSSAAVRALLKFLYTGEADAAACASHTMDVLGLASQHEQPELKARCEMIASEFIYAESVCNIFVAASLHDLKGLEKKCIAFMEQNVVKLSLPEIIQLADKHNIPELRAAYERGATAGLKTATAVAFLEAALNLDMPLLRAGCLAFIKVRIALAISPGFVRLATLHPLLWRELRAAAGVAEERAGEAELRAADPARESDNDY